MSLLCAVKTRGFQDKDWPLHPSQAWLTAWLTIHTTLNGTQGPGQPRSPANSLLLTHPNSRPHRSDQPVRPQHGENDHSHRASSSFGSSGGARAEATSLETNMLPTHHVESVEQEDQRGQNQPEGERSLRTKRQAAAWPMTTGT